MVIKPIKNSDQLILTFKVVFLHYEAHICFVAPDRLLLQNGSSDSKGC